MFCSGVYTEGKAKPKKLSWDYSCTAKVRLVRELILHSSVIMVVSTFLQWAKLPVPPGVPSVSGPSPQLRGTNSGATEVNSFKENQARRWERQPKSSRVLLLSWEEVQWLGAFSLKELPEPLHRWFHLSCQFMMNTSILGVHLCSLTSALGTWSLQWLLEWFIHSQKPLLQGKGGWGVHRDKTALSKELPGTTCFL